MKFTSRERFVMFLAGALIVMLILFIIYIMSTSPVYLAKIPEGTAGTPDVYGLFMTYYEKLVNTEMQFISTILLLMGASGFGILVILWNGFQQFSKIQTDAQKIERDLAGSRTELVGLDTAIQDMRNGGTAIFRTVFDQLWTRDKDEINSEMRVLTQLVKTAQKDVKIQLPRWATLAEIDDLNLKLLSGDIKLIKYAKRRLLEYAKDDDGVVRSKSVRVFEDIVTYRIGLSQADIDDIRKGLSVVEQGDREPGVRKAATRVITLLSGPAPAKQSNPSVGA